jgi:hypothetical protein
MNKYSNKKYEDVSFKSPNCPAAVSFKYAKELQTKKDLRTGQPLTQSQLIWRSGYLACRKYEANWYKASPKTQTVSQNSSTKKKPEFIQHEFTSEQLNKLFDDLDTVKLH